MTRKEFLLSACSRFLKQLKVENYGEMGINKNGGNLP
jgi:hypothetical protein